MFHYMSSLSGDFTETLFFMTITKRAFATTTAATFAAAFTSLYAAPELQADILELTFSPGFIGQSSTAQNVRIDTAGTTVASFAQLNDVTLGKTLYSGGLESVRFANLDEVLTASFSGGSSVVFNGSATGIAYVGFRSANGVGWFSLDLGGAGGDITYGRGQLGIDGMEVTVGAAVPEPTNAALAVLALGAIGVRRNRKKM